MRVEGFLIFMVDMYTSNKILWGIPNKLKAGSIAVFFTVFLSAIVSGRANDMVWAKTGHRVVGEVAENHLNGKAKRAIRDLLQGQSLADVSNFADEIKSDRSYSKYTPWHYVNFPLDKKYTDVPPSTLGDLIMAIRECQEVIRDKNSSREEKVFHLKMLVHFMGDLHQPLHIGRAEDRGGNDIQLQWFDRGSNLHRVWDANMINDYGMSYSELARTLPMVSRKERKQIQSGELMDWVMESRELAKEIYNSVNVGEKLYYRYSYVWWPTVEDQLLKGGLRLAKVLNDVFK